VSGQLYTLATLPLGKSPCYPQTTRMGLDTLEMRKQSSQQAKKARKLKHNFITKIRTNDLDVTVMKNTVISVGLITFNK
jgi:hypothetical protein